MVKRLILGVCMFVFVFPSDIFAISLKESIIEAVQTHPKVKEKLRIYRASQQELHIAESDFYPKIDVVSQVGYEKSSGFLSDTDTKGYENYGLVLQLSHNIFNGFKSGSQLKYQEAHILAMAYEYLSTANDIAFAMAQAYIEVKLYDKQLKIAKENIKLYKKIYQNIKYRTQQGKATRYDVSQVFASLARAQSYFYEVLQKLNDARYKYRSILGKMPELLEMEPLSFSVTMPKTEQIAATYAINHNPLLFAYNYKIKMIQSLKKESESGFYPKIDFVLKQNYINTDNPYQNKDDSLSALVVLKYNLYNGSKDKALAQRNISFINQAIEAKRVHKKELVEGIDIAWNRYTMTQAQLPYLQKYISESKKVFQFTLQKYNINKITVHELLMAQKDFIDAKLAVNDAKYQSLIAQYKVLTLMNVFPSIIVGSKVNFGAIVNLYTSQKARFILDKEIVKFDVDDDKIADNKDLCDNSLNEDDIMPYGCKYIEDIKPDINLYLPHLQPVPTHKRKKVHKRSYKKKKADLSLYFQMPSPKKKKKREETSKYLKPGTFMAENKIPDPFQDIAEFQKKQTPFKVTPAQNDKLVDCIDVPSSYQVDSKGCAKLATFLIPSNFEKSSVPLSKEMEKKIIQLSQFLKQNPNLKIHIVGYSSKTPTSNYLYNLQLSKKRAKRFKKELVKRGVPSNMITTNGRGFNNPVASNDTPQGRRLNRRVEITFLR
ncbi:Outer membrane protein [hydrothermal vent metagenome]|uniref:Outer membrane protein n=1 Tax=hydrothermal vent metagenome TaxID=652676 RepID=A0A1W1D560_9ZZZZ